MMSTIFFFLVAVFILVTVHEAGHFFTARYCGVQVDRFSIGFGPVLWSKRYQNGTQFTLSLIPLGGYVKFIDDAQGPLPKFMQGRLFQNQSTWAKASIILAGPMVNFLLAFVLFWLAAVIGMPALAPIVGEVAPNSLADEIGIQPNDEWLSINGKSVHSWQDVRYALIPLIGTQSGHVSLLVQSKHSGVKSLQLPLGKWTEPSEEMDNLAQLGVQPLIPVLPLKIGEVVPKTPASRAHFQVGDEILGVNDQSLDDWKTLIQYMKQQPKAYMTFQIKRGEQVLDVDVQLEKGILGIKSEKPNWPKHLLRIDRNNPFQAFVTAYKKWALITTSTIQWMFKLFTGDLPLKHLSGPIGIAQGASLSAQGGVVYFLTFLGIISIGLAVINCLPIPILDGGHLVIIAIEHWMGKPLSGASKAIGMLFGMVILSGLMVIALRNDLLRLTGVAS